MTDFLQSDFVTTYIFKYTMTDFLQSDFVTIFRFINTITLVNRKKWNGCEMSEHIIDQNLVNMKKW